MPDPAGPPRPVPGAASPPAPARPAPGGGDWVYTCERCGERMAEQKCKIICPRCGAMRDCSDP